MRKKNTSIPINAMVNDAGSGISIERMAVKDLSIADKAILNTYENGKQSHRHDGHSFFLLESGTVAVDIDFEKYTMVAPAVIYVHPDQVHHTITSENVTVSSLAISTENLNPEYLAILGGIGSAKPVLLQPDTFTLISDAVSLCIKLAERKTDKLHHSLLKDGCNTLVALVISQYLAQAKPVENLSRFDAVTKAFRDLLELNYTTLKRPTAYAQRLNLSTPYLNECVKNTSGYSVSHHIQQRVILEAKRLLAHSDKSVKEIAAALGYDDYPYFSRLFTKVTGITALAFRNKNLG